VSCRTRRRAGFSLIEILVATSLLLVIGGAAATLLMQAFALWEHGVARTRRLAATDAFLTAFARDFAAAQRSLGFTGDVARCQFWTLEVPAERPPRLARVEYALTPEAILRRADGDGAEEPRETRFAPVEPAELAYALPAADGDAWAAEWAVATNAPLRVRLQPLPGPGSERVYWPSVLKRATP
jgi:prepilin-type N-terminal cleavage/methylation domain-containing protein